VDEWLQLVLGPLGALALAVTAAVVMTRELGRRHSAEVQWLRDEIARLQVSVRETRAQLDAEQIARVRDAKSSNAAILEVSDRVHSTICRLEDLVQRREGD
jgi:alkylation response protein AidB-like acyl-CoA dehydrogenase